MASKSVALTEGYFAKTSFHPRIAPDAGKKAYWVVWEAASEKNGTKCLARRIAERGLGPILELTERGGVNGSPCCVAAAERMNFFWLSADGNRWAVRTRSRSGKGFSEPRVVSLLPDGAKPGELHAAATVDGTAWIAWTQMTKGRNTVMAAAWKEKGPALSFSIAADSPYNFRPCLTSLSDDALYLVWDAYRNRTYDVYGCRLSLDGASKVERISRDGEWENKARITRLPSGELCAVWVRWQDVEWRRRIIQQTFSVRAARFAKGCWQPLKGNNGTEDIVDLNYGLLSEPPQQCVLGHQGNRLSPMVKSDEAGRIWLLYEIKADKWQGTNKSTGRLAAVCLEDDRWSEPLEITSGSVGYVLPDEDVISRDVPIVSRDLKTDEYFIEQVNIKPRCGPIPIEKRSVSLEGWKRIDLIHSNAAKSRRPKSKLAGEEYRLYWGDFHVHSSMSHELEGDPDELTIYARDKARIDVLCISDNDVFWNRTVRPTQRFMTDFKFAANLGNAALFDHPGKFVVFPGWEFSANRGPGFPHDHRAVFSASDEMNIEHAFDNEDLDVGAFIRRAKEKGYYVLPHHGDWNWYDADAGCNADVVSGSTRNLEDYDNIYRFLSAGCKIGFTGSSDGHFRNPGFGGALTGLWAKALDRESVLEALYAHRCYATRGARIVMEFSADGWPMGSSLTVVRKPLLRWRVEAEDDEYVLRIIRDGRSAYEQTFRNLSEGEWADGEFSDIAPGLHYFFLEVASTTPVAEFPTNVAAARGRKCWSSPIWVEKARPI